MGLETEAAAPMMSLPGPVYNQHSIAKNNHKN